MKRVGGSKTFDKDVCPPIGVKPNSEIVRKRDWIIFLSQLYSITLQRRNRSIVLHPSLCEPEKTVEEFM